MLDGGLKSEIASYKKRRNAIGKDGTTWHRHLKVVTEDRKTSFTRDSGCIEETCTRWLMEVARSIMTQQNEVYMVDGAGSRI